MIYRFILGCFFLSGYCWISRLVGRLVEASCLFPPISDLGAGLGNRIDLENLRFYTKKCDTANWTSRQRYKDSCMLLQDCFADQRWYSCTIVIHWDWPADRLPLDRPYKWLFPTNRSAPALSSCFHSISATRMRSPLSSANSHGPCGTQGTLSNPLLLFQMVANPARAPYFDFAVCWTCKIWLS